MLPSTVYRAEQNELTENYHAFLRDLERYISENHSDPCRLSLRRV